MATKKHEQKFSIMDLLKGGIPNPAGYPIPRPCSDRSSKSDRLNVGEETPKYHIPSKTEKK